MADPILDLQRVKRRRRYMTMLTGEQRRGRIARRQARNKEVQGHRGPERNEIEAQTPGQVAHARPPPRDVVQSGRRTDENCSRPMSALGWARPAAPQDTEVLRLPRARL